MEITSVSKKYQVRKNKCSESSFSVSVFYFQKYNFCVHCLGHIMGLTLLVKREILDEKDKV